MGILLGVAQVLDHTPLTVSSVVGSPTHNPTHSRRSRLLEIITMLFITLVSVMSRCFPYRHICRSESITYPVLTIVVFLSVRTYTVLFVGRVAMVTVAMVTVAMLTVAMVTVAMVTVAMVVVT